MSKKTNQSKRPTPTPAVVLFGIDEANKPHAAYFDEAHVELATKAAGLMGLNVLKVANHEQAKIACSLPAGRIYANGRGFVPYVRKDLYSKVTELAGTQATRQLRGPQSIASTEGPSSGSSIERQPANPAGPRAARACCQPQSPGSFDHRGELGIEVGVNPLFQVVQTGIQTGL
jgi:hypothetical protein